MRALHILTGIVFFTAWQGFATARADTVVIDVKTKATKGLYPLAVPTPVSSDPELAALVTQVQTFNFTVSSWFKVLDERSFLADLKTEGLSLEPKRWKDVGAFGVVKARVTRSGTRAKLSFKLYEVEKGALAVLERRYEGDVSQVRSFVHKWCNDVVQYYTSEPGFFGTRIAFVQEGRKRKSIAVMDFDGNRLQSVTHNRYANILPAWSPSGNMLAFTSFMRNNPDLYIKTLPNSRPRRIAKYQGMNTGASWSPDGSRIAVTLSKDGNAEIYVLKAANGKVAKRLTNNRYIDTSPAYSPNGKEIAFVSDREGSPQIFVMSASGGSAKRESTRGTYNQTPAWCPMQGRRILAFTARDDVSGRSDIITIDLDSHEQTRVTQGQGNNEEPTWAPGCRAIAFSSRRKSGAGIYVGNADGTGEQVRVYKGRATSPDWGPAQ